MAHRDGLAEEMAAVGVARGTAPSPTLCGCGSRDGLPQALPLHKQALLPLPFLLMNSSSPGCCFWPPAASVVFLPRHVIQTSLAGRVLQVTDTCSWAPAGSGQRPRGARRALHEAPGTPRARGTQGHGMVVPSWWQGRNLPQHLRSRSGAAAPRR